METAVYSIEDVKKDKEKIRQAGERIKQGGLVAFPTETVYGLGADALQAGAAASIFLAKGRPSDNPLIVHIAAWEAMHRIALDVPEIAKKLADAFWPGPLTMIVKKAACVPDETTGGLDTVAVRMPDHPAALALIEAAGGYIAAPSANTSGKPSPTTAQHVQEDLWGKIDIILDGGPVGIGLESTIVDLSSDVPTILRPGAITPAMLETVIGTVQMDKGLIAEDSHEKPKAPGMKYRHYAPKAPLIVVEGAAQAVAEEINRKALQYEKGQVGILCSKETAAQYSHGIVRAIGSTEHEEEIAQNLYGILREFDTLDVACIYSEAFDTPVLGQAIMNRLLKAAGQKKLQLSEGEKR